MAKYNISISLEDKGILSVTMEFSISCRNIIFASENYISVFFSGYGQLRPVQTGLVHMTNRNRLQQGRLCDSDLSGLKYKYL